MTPGQWIASKLVTAINAAPIADPYVAGVSLPMSPNTAAVVKLPRFTLEDLADLKTCVASRSRSLTPGGRGPRKHDLACQIMLLKKVDAEHTELDALIELMYAIDILVSRQPDLGWTGSSNDPEYDTDMLETQCVFKSVITATFSANL